MSELLDRAFPGGDAGEVVHIFCCVDEDLGLCGADISEDEVVAPEDEEATCWVCQRYDRSHTCPVKGACDELGGVGDL